MHIVNSFSADFEDTVPFWQDRSVSNGTWAWHRYGDFAEDNVTRAFDSSFIFYDWMNAASDCIDGHLSTSNGPNNSITTQMPTQSTTLRSSTLLSTTPRSTTSQSTQPLSSTAFPNTGSNVTMPATSTAKQTSATSTSTTPTSTTPISTT
ncbi:mucin-5AC-like [Patiria miniata]|uniref:Uncharacterized protein n=1 Tax=Patiria miniata TaxID=46514 RepID=A0A913ZHA9_PATMI|nr:mucin-5AC-like [Patiria miniata]